MWALAFFIWESYSNAYLDRIILALIYGKKKRVSDFCPSITIAFIATKIVAEDQK
jgi:nitrate/nitrite transport system permease protein